jgi:hypothetical protein
VSGDGLLTRSDLQLDGGFCLAFFRAVSRRADLFDRAQLELMARRVLDRRTPDTLYKLRGLLLLFLFAPLFRPSDDFFGPLFDAIARAQPAAARVLFAAFRQATELIEIVVPTVHAVVNDFVVSHPTTPHCPETHRCAIVLEFLAAANAASERPLSWELFANEKLTSLIVAVNEYQLVCRRLFSFLDTPAIVGASIKRRLLRMESKLAGQLRLSVRRYNIRSDFERKTAPLEPGEFRKSLSVIFEGEEGQDEGGVSREFFLVAGAEFAEDRELFDRVNKDTFHWFHPNWVRPRRDALQAAGRLTRMALVNGAQVPFHFPVVVYKKLRGEQLTMADALQIFPDEAQTLLGLRGQADIADIGLTFSITEGHSDVPLRTDGDPGEAVTSKNFEEYVQLWLRHRLVKQVDASFVAFRSGFLLDGETSFMSMLPSHDLVLLVSGSDDLDWAALKNGTKYNGYTANSPAVLVFWRVFDSLTVNEKLMMLLYATAFPRAPVGGLKTLQLTIGKLEKPKTVPTASTCTLTLLLPDILDERVVRRNMQICMDNSTGFGNR